MMNDPFLAAEQSGGAVASGESSAGSNPFQQAEAAQPSSAPDHLAQAVSSLQRVQQEPSLANHMQAVNDSSNSIGQSTMAFMDTFNKQMGDLPRGLAQILGLGNLKAQGGMSVNEQQAQAEHDAIAARKSNPIAAAAGDITGFAGNAINATALGMGASAGLGMAAPGTAAKLGTMAGDLADNSPMLAKMGQSAVQNGLWAGAQAVDPGQSHLDNALGGAAVGALIPPGVEVAKGVGNALADTVPAKFAAGVYNRTVPPVMGYLNKVFNPKGAAAGEMADTLEHYGVTPESLQAANAPANRLGATLSLGESVGGAETNQGIAALEGKMGSGDLEAAQLANAHLNNLKQTIGDSVTGIANKLVPEGTPEEVGAMTAAGRDALKGYNIPQEQLQTLASNPALKDYMAAANKSSLVPQDIQALPDTNAYKLNYINRQINGDLYENTSSITKDPSIQMSGDERIALTQAKSLLQNTINDNTPNNMYKNLMDLTSRDIQRNTLLNNLNDAVKGQATMNPDGTMQTSLQSLYNNLWKTPEQQQRFMDIVQKAGGDPQVAQDIMYTVNHAINSPVQKILSGTRVAAETTRDRVDAEGIFKEAWNALTTDDYKNELLKLSLGGAPAQAKIIKAMQSAPLSDKIVALHQALGQIAPKAATSVLVNQQQPQAMQQQ